MDQEHVKPKPEASSQASVIAIILCLVAVTLSIIILVTQSDKKSAQYDPELESLKNQRDEIRESLGLTGGVSPVISNEFLISRIQADASSLSSAFGQMSDELSNKDLIIRAKEEEITQSVTLREAYVKEIALLSKQLEESREQNTEVQLLKQKLQDNQSLLAMSKDAQERLRQQLGEAPSAKSLERALSQLSVSEEEIKSLKEQLANAAQPEVISQLKSEINRLKLELQKLRAEANRNRLFAESSDLLSPRALLLYNTLSGLEGGSNEERLHQYERIRSELNATVVETVTFSTGSAAVDLQEVGVIEDNLSETASDSEYLIVGYASTSGDIAINKELSAKRATTVATITDSVRQSKQAVKAVFLGQTDRFSKTNDFANQICEIWEIKSL